MGSGKFNVLEGANKFSSQNFENDRDRNKRYHPCLEICWRVNDISHPNTRLGICFLCIYRLLRRYEWVINVANHVCICNLYCAQQTHRLIKDTAWSADTSLSITIIRDLRRRPQPKRMQRREARPGSSHCTKVVKFYPLQWWAVTVPPSEIWISQEPWQESQNGFGAP